VIDLRPPAPVPVGPDVAPSSTNGVAAAEAEVATPQTENAREAGEARVATAIVTVKRRDEAPVPAAPLPEAPAESPVPWEPRRAVAPGPAVSTSGLIRSEPVPLTRTVRVRVAPWRSRLLADAIVPTEPMPVAQPEPVAALRARLLAEAEARRPEALRAPQGRWGVALDLGPLEPGELPVWRDADGVPPSGATVTGGRAEILWAPTAGGGERQFRLTRPDGLFIAEVRVAADGRDFTVRTNEETRAWLLLAVHVAPPHLPERGAGAAAKPFAWRSGSGGSLPAGWREREGVAATGEAIAEAPLGSLPGAAALQIGALFDPESGWAIVADIRQAADRPLEN
jgi:hypothetical protein